ARGRDSQSPLPGLRRHDTQRGHGRRAEGLRREAQAQLEGPLRTATRPARAQLARRREPRLPADIQNVALRKLRLLNRAPDLNDLRVPPGNRLEVLKASRSGQHSIRINDQWRICFVWTAGGYPGEILAEEFIKPMGLTQNALARAIG